MVASVRPLPSEVPIPRSKVLRAAEPHALRDDLAALLAHDLRTPLAAISMNLDFVLDELAGTPQKALIAALDDCRVANARAVRIVTDMAEAVQLAAGDRSPSFSDVDVSQVIAETIHRAMPEATSRGVQMVFTAEARVIQADPDLLSRALDRIVERALRHARTDRAIHIALQPDAIAVCVDSALPCAAELTTRTMATYFADVAMRVQGGSLRIDTSADEALIYRLVFPR
jgi:K+-sensing histidine kinase KdpD